VGHDFIDIGLGLLVSALCGLTVRFLNRIDALEKGKEEHAEEIRDTRSAISRIEGHLGIAPFPYKS
jgi:hypothetical protein